MGSSDAQKKAVREYQKKCDAIMLRPLKEDGQAIRAAAMKSESSTQGYILEAALQKVEADSTGKHLVILNNNEAQVCADNAGQTLNEWLTDHKTFKE